MINKPSEYPFESHIENSLHIQRYKSHAYTEYEKPLFGGSKKTDKN